MNELNKPTIADMIVQSGEVKWKELRILQNPSLKDISRDSMEKLKKSIVENSFMTPFYVWKEDDTLWLLDGSHRIKALVELEHDGYVIPEMLPAKFVDCKNRKQAAELVIIYSSIYARITEEGFVTLIDLEGITLDEMETVDLPGLNINEAFKQAAIVSDFFSDLEANALQEGKVDHRIHYECCECGYKW